MCYDVGMKTIQYQNKAIHFVATAHVSRKSVAEVKEVIEATQPDLVCIELDAGRAETLLKAKSEQNIDLKEIIKSGKTFSFLANLILSSYQKRLAQDLETEVGGEMKQAILSAKEVGARIAYIDRDIQVTMQRLWRGLGFFKKVNLMAALIVSVFSKEEINEEEIEELKHGDLLYQALTEMDESLPEVSKQLLHERNAYMAEKLKQSQAETIVCVIGAAHLEGIISALDEEHDLKELRRIPEKKKSYWGYIIPGLFIIGLVLLTFQSPSLAFNQLLVWIALSSGLAALGALLCLAHPLTILVAALSAPISVLSPVLAVGFFTGLSEIYFRSPTVQDFENLAHDATKLKAWYSNRVLRVLLVVIVPNILVSIGTFIAGSSIFLNLFR